jgi:hypothetical protein
MHSSRRTFLSLGIPLSLVAIAAAAQRHAHLPTPQRGANRQSPADLNLGNSGSLPQPDPRILKENQEELKKQVQQLYTLAGELKMETERTDSASVLSLPVLKKAEQIQKIAKHIQSLARG